MLFFVQAPDLELQLVGEALALGGLDIAALQRLLALHERCGALDVAANVQKSAQVVLRGLHDAAIYPRLAAH